MSVMISEDKKELIVNCKCGCEDTIHIRVNDKDKDSDYYAIQTIAHYPVMVVVNARGKDNRILGIVKEIMPIEEYGKNVTAQVVGVVNMDSYLTRVEEENRLKELAKKKAAIEKALDAEIKKRKDAEYYEKIAKEYSDNPLITQLVAELKELEE